MAAMIKSLPVFDVKKFPGFTSAPVASANDVLVLSNFRMKSGSKGELAGKHQTSRPACVSLSPAANTNPNPTATGIDLTDTEVDVYQSHVLSYIDDVALYNKAIAQLGSRWTVSKKPAFTFATDWLPAGEHA